MYMAGVTLEQFGKLNMKQMHYIANAYAEKQEFDFKRSDEIAYIQGQYVMDAILCTVVNMLSKSFGGNADFQYPERAYTMAKEENKLSEDEIQRQREQFIATLKTMERNFKLSKKQKKGSE